MKRFKKAAAFFLTLIITVMFAVPAFAQEGAYSITIEPTTANHTYNVYQIFSGDISGTDETTEGTSGYVLANIQWGDSVNNPDSFLDALQAQNGDKYNSCTSAADVAEQLVNAADLDEFLEVINSGSYLGSPVATEPADGTSAVINLSEAGYYLVKDTLAEGDAENEFVSDYIVQVLGNETMAPKGDVPEIRKKVKDINDSEDSDGYTDWQDSADYDIGDSVPFQITATVGSDYDNYKTYAFTIHDTQSSGLSFNNDIEVAVDGTPVNEEYYDVVTEDLGDGCTFHVVFDNLKNIADVEAGSSITVEYTSELTEGAAIGSQGNPNEVSLEYSNNPNGGGTGKTPEDTVIVFTYKTDVIKVDSESAPLEGAQFTLEKWIADSSGEGGSWGAPRSVTVSGDDNNIFSFTGLDDGKYRLKETVTPDGYNTIDPIVFTVTANHTTTDGTAAAYAAPSAEGAHVDESDTPIDGAIEVAFESIAGGVQTTVVNESGALLPETGGMGTTVFFVLGGCLVVGAGILLVVRFRMRKDEEA